MLTGSCAALLVLRPHLEARTGQDTQYVRETIFSPRRRAGDGGSRRRLERTADRTTGYVPGLPRAAAPWAVTDPARRLTPRR